jgi:parallel beta-helix repeat protein
MITLRRALRHAVLASLFAAAATAAAPAAGASAATGCDRVAAPGGSNSAAGTEAAPYATAQKLVDSVAPGQVGCLRGGRYSENVRVNHGGTSDSNRVIIRSFPGERAAIHGRLYVPDESNFVTFEQLDLNGHDSPMCGTVSDYCQQPSPTVNGDDVIFQDDDVTNDHSGICFALGNQAYGAAQRVIIRRNRIHDCGRIPSSNHDHGIYLSDANDVQILDNVIYDNADRGIQLYPAADRTVVRGNIIDGNGEGVIFSGEGGDTSDDNVVENNVITNAKIRFNVESWYPNGSGSGNVARNNCLYGGKQGNVGTQDGFKATSNLVVDPQYTDRGAKDFRLKPGSPCAAVLAGAQLPAAPLDTSGQPDTQTNAPATATTGNGSTPTTQPSGKPGNVVLQSASVKPSKRRGRSRVRVAGHISGGGARKVKVQMRRGGSWKTIGIVRNVGNTFRIVLNTRVRGLTAADRPTVRVVVPGAVASNPVRARSAH